MLSVELALALFSLFTLTPSNPCMAAFTDNLLAYSIQQYETEVWGDIEHLNVSLILRRT